MGDRYTLDRKCAYCKEMNADIWYAPTCGSYTFKCKHCGKHNFITSNFKAVKIEKATLKDVKTGFYEATTGLLTEDQIDRSCKDYFEQIKKLR